MPSEESRAGAGEDPGVTHLLGRARQGDDRANAELLPLVYEQLQGLARAIFSQQSPGHTLQPTALVHEAWMKMAPNLDPIEDGRHFFVVAGRAMRQVLADHARGKLAEKRGGHQRQLTLHTVLAGEGEAGLDFVELDDSLRRLAERNEQHAAVAELRIFSGLSIDETAASLGLSPRTVDSYWAMAKAWLRRELAPEE